MKSRWPVVRLGDYCSKIGSGATPRGGKESYLDVGPVALIRSQNVYNDGFRSEGLVYISEDQAAKLAHVSVEPQDVLINITGDSVARVCLAPSDVLPARVNQHVAIIRTRPDDIDPRYLRYFLLTPSQQQLLLGLAGGGATRKALTKAMLENLRIPKPPIEVQRRMVEPLDLIERAISLNRRINNTLQSIAQAIFKSWFIDFDPVHAKAAGREPEGIDAETAALFPSEFEDSELGPIPKGWKVGSLGELVSLSRDTVRPSDSPDVLFEHYSLPAYDSGQVPSREYGAEIKSSKTRVRPGTVLQSKLNPHIPRVWLPGAVGPNAVCSTEFLVWLPRKGVPRAYVYCLLKSRHFIEMVQALATGTSNSHQRVRPEQVSGLPIVIPTSEVLGAFSQIVEPLFQRVNHSREQSRLLTSLRDTLLPRLISGKLRIPEAEELVQEAVS